MSPDESFMSRALDLAEASLGLASPNPQVGCVLVRDGRLLGAGAHLYDHLDHAEIVALKQVQSAGHATLGATAYVTLEPCSHHGRTPPCADALIRAGIARCVVATVDPNPLVAGQGIARMRAAGIQVEVGLCQARARTLNNAFACSITRQRPFVTLKAALSVDGRLAPSPANRTPGAPFWLTGPEARAEVHRLRHASDCILTGIGTVLADDPLLTDRSNLSRRRPLVRVLLDTHLRVPLSAKLLQNTPETLWIFCGPDADRSRRRTLEALVGRVTPVNLSTLHSQLTTVQTGLSSRLNLQEILHHLHTARLLSVLIEAGSVLNSALLNANLVDQVILFYAEAELGPQAIPFAAQGPTPFALEEKFLTVAKKPFGPDVCVSGLLHNPWEGSGSS